MVGLLPHCTLLLTVVLAIHCQLLNEQLEFPRCSEHDILLKIDKIPDPLDGKRYFLCENDFMTLKECEYDQVFDLNSSGCVPSGQEKEEKLLDGKQFDKLQDDRIGTRNTHLLSVDRMHAVVEDELHENYSSFVCPSKRNRSYPHANDCRRYFYCEDGISVELKCPLYFLFDVKTEKCLFFLLATCAGSLVTSPGTITTYAPPTCTQYQVSDSPYPYDCKHYYHCSYGEGSLKTCGRLQFFDRKRRECRFFLLADCKNSDKVQENIIHDDQTIKIFRKGTLTNEHINPPQCNDDDVFRKPYPGKCKKYYDCDHGNLKVYSCFFIFNFDPISLNCTWFWKVNCPYIQPTTTTTATSIISTNSTYPSTGTQTTVSASTPSNATNSSATSSSASFKTTLSPFTNSTDAYKSPFIIIPPRDIDETKNNSLKIEDLHKSNIENYTCRSYGVYDDIYPYDCHKYYRCNEGKLTIESCSFLKNFDPLKLKCRWFFLVDCQARPIVTTTTEITSTTDTETTETEETTELGTSTTVLETTTTPHPIKTTRHKRKTTKHHRKTTHHKKKTSYDYHEKNTTENEVNNYHEVNDRNK